MGVRGERPKRKKVDETTLLGNIDDIIQMAKTKGYIINNKVDIEGIIEENGIELRTEKLNSAVSGYLRKEKNKWIIGVNSLHHRNRQRFTMAHEFAHYCLHKDKNENEYFEDETTTFFRNENRSSIEYTANEFASDLLMPKDLFLEAVRSGMTKVSQLSEEFEVSPAAIRLRAQSLNLRPKNKE